MFPILLRDLLKLLGKLDIDTMGMQFPVAPGHWYEVQADQGHAVVDDHWTDRLGDFKRLDPI